MIDRPDIVDPQPGSEPVPDDDFPLDPDVNDPLDPEGPEIER